MVPCDYGRKIGPQSHVVEPCGAEGINPLVVIDFGITLMLCDEHVTEIDQAVTGIQKPETN